MRLGWDESEMLIGNLEGVLGWGIERFDFLVEEIRNFLVSGDDDF